MDDSHHIWMSLACIKEHGEFSDYSLILAFWKLCILKWIWKMIIINWIKLIKRCGLEVIIVERGKREGNLREENWGGLRNRRKRGKRESEGECGMKMMDRWNGPTRRRITPVIGLPCLPLPPVPRNLMRTEPERKAKTRSVVQEESGGALA